MCKKNINELIISLDVGKYETKAIGRDVKGSCKDIKKVSFRTKYYNVANGEIDLAGNSYRIQYEGKEYIVGEQGIEDSNETSKTNLLHKLSAYAAISNYIEEDTDNEINVVLACPLSVLKIKNAKEEYKNYIANDNKEVNININSKEYRFTIKDITIKAEGSGILYTNPDLFINRNVGVIDFGGLNMGFSEYRNGVCNANDRFIEEYGVKKLTQMVQDVLSELENGNLASYAEAEKVLEVGYRTELGQIDIISSEKVKETKQKFLEDALKVIRARGYGLKKLDGLIFVGGTTQKIKEQIMGIFPNATIPADSKWTTCEGLYKIAAAKYLK